MDLGSEPVSYNVYVDRLQKSGRTFNLESDIDRASFYRDAVYAEGYYGDGVGVKDLELNFQPNTGYRLAEEFWCSTKEPLILRNRILRFVKREGN